MDSCSDLCMNNVNHANERTNGRKNDWNKRNAILQEQKSVDFFFLHSFVHYLFLICRRTHTGKKRTNLRLSKNTEAERSALAFGCKWKILVKFEECRIFQLEFGVPPGSVRFGSAQSLENGIKNVMNMSRACKSFGIPESVFFNPLLKHNKYDFHEFGISWVALAIFLSGKLSKHINSRSIVSF